MIPKIILQTSKLPYPQYVRDQWQRRIDKSWTIKWFDDESIIKYFEENPLPEFPNIIDVFYSFSDGGHRADLFRYYYLYLNGGFFIDSDCMSHVHMNNIYSYVHDHILVTADVACNRMNHSELLGDSPIIFNGFMACVAGSKIVYEALKNAYTTKPRLLTRHRLYFVYMLYVITQQLKSQYNILFFTENQEHPTDLTTYTVDHNGRKIMSHYFGHDKIIPATVELKPAESLL